MKKIVSLGIAASMLAATAAVVSAAEVSTIGVKADLTEIKAGDEITVTVSAVKAGGDLAAFVITANGMTEVAGTGTYGATVTEIPLDSSYLSCGKASGGFAEGEVLYTVKYKIADPAAAEVKIAVATGVESAVTVSEDAASVKFTVAAGDSSTPVDDSSTPTGDSSTPTGDSSTPAGESSTPAGESSTPVGGDDKPVDTGVALAVIPVALAAAGVIVAKKKRS